MRDFKTIAKKAVHHGKYLINGMMLMVYGVLTAGLVMASVYGFMAIPAEGGYVAVCDFAVSTLTICVAFSCMYAMGRGRKKGRYCGGK